MITATGKRLLRICLITAVMMLICMLPGVASNANAETETISHATITLEPGESLVPLHESSIWAYYKNLKYTVDEGYPIIQVAIWRWYEFVKEQNSYVWRSSKDDIFDRDSLYECELQVLLPLNEDGEAEWLFANNATLAIGDHVFTLRKQEINTRNVFAYFTCEGIYPRYLRVGSHVITDDNKDDVLKEEDAGSTVSYDITNNVLTLNNAALHFDGSQAIPEEAEEFIGPEFAVILAGNSDLNLNIKGQNSIVSEGADDPECYELYGTYQYSTNEKYYTTSVDGDGELSIVLDGDDFHMPKYLLDRNYDKATWAIRGQNVRINGAKTDIMLKNCEDATGICSYVWCDMRIGGNAEIVMHDQNVIRSNMFLHNEYDLTFMIGGNSKVSCELEGFISRAMFCGDLEISDNAVLSITTQKEPLMVNGSLIFFNHEGTALVNTEPTEKGRSVWDEVTSLTDESLRYIRIPGLTHVEAVEPAVGQRGNIEYYYDELSDRYFADPAGNDELSESEVFIDPLVPKVTVTVGVYDQTEGVSGQGGSYTFNDEDMTHTAFRHIVESGSDVGLVAAPAAGYEFVGWFEGNVVEGSDDLMIEPVGAVGSEEPAGRFKAESDVVLCAVFREIIPDEKVSIDGAKVTGITDKVYTGSAIKQSPKVRLGDATLRQGTDYEISYKNNKKVGKATVTITGTGDYEGSVSKIFKINPKPTTMSGLTALSKGFTAKWAKRSVQLTGYQLQYCTNSKFMSGYKNVKIGSYKTVSKKVTKLQAGKKYFVRVRTFKTVDGKDYYSIWSTAKSVTTKK